MTDLTHARVPGCTQTMRPRRVSLWSYLALRRQRRTLAQLDNTRLADLGLTRTQAQAEAQRPIWDVPSHWCE
ncbi:MAG: DUF1127 domain-containing protein [Roseovarius sp.]